MTITRKQLLIAKVFILLVMGANLVNALLFEHSRILHAFGSAALVLFLIEGPGLAARKAARKAAR